MSLELLNIEGIDCFPTIGDRRPRYRYTLPHCMLSADGLLMPAKKDHAPPDLYFEQTRK